MKDSMSIVGSDANEAATDRVMKGLSGHIQIGKEYYFFTVTYHYIGRVASIDNEIIKIEDAIIVSNAGSEDDAVSKILNRKSKPENSEKPGVQILIFKQSLTAVIPMAK